MNADRPPQERPAPHDLDVRVLEGIAAEAADAAGGIDAGLLDGFLVALATAVSTGQPLPRAQARRCRAAGRDAARAGVPLPALLDLYLSASWRLWAQLPTVRSPAQDAGAVATGGEVMLRGLDSAVSALSRGYQQARRRLVREQESTRRELVDDLLSGGSGMSRLVERAAGLGLDLPGPHGVAAVQAAIPFADGTASTDAVDQAVQAASGVPTLVASKDTLLVIVFAAPTTSASHTVAEALSGVLGPPPGTGVDLRRHVDVGAWRAGMSRVRVGPAGVRASWAEARSVLDLAARLRRPDPVAYAADLLAHQMLSRDRAALDDLIETVLTPLRDARGGAQPLVDTLAAYFDAGGIAAAAARAIHLSVRAMSYRLDRVHALTGYDPTDPQDQFLLHAAVIGAKLQDWPGKR